MSREKQRFRITINLDGISWYMKSTSKEAIKNERITGI